MYMLPMNYKGDYLLCISGARRDLMDKYDIKSVASLDEAEAHMDAIVATSPRHPAGRRFGLRKAVRVRPYVAESKLELRKR